MKILLHFLANLISKLGYVSSRASSIKFDSIFKGIKFQQKMISCKFKYPYGTFGEFFNLPISMYENYFNAFPLSG